MNLSTELEIEVFFILFFNRNPNVLMFKKKKKIESRRVSEANDNGEETVEYSTAIPEPATEGIFLINKVFNIRKVLFIEMYFATC